MKQSTKFLFIFGKYKLHKATNEMVLNL